MLTNAEYAENKKEIEDIPDDELLELYREHARIKDDVDRDEEFKKLWEGGIAQAVLRRELFDRGIEP